MLQCASRYLNVKSKHYKSFVCYVAGTSNSISISSSTSSLESKTRQCKRWKPLLPHSHHHHHDNHDHHHPPPPPSLYFSISFNDANFQHPKYHTDYLKTATKFFMCITAHFLFSFLQLLAYYYRYIYLYYLYYYYRLIIIWFGCWEFCMVVLVWWWWRWWWCGVIVLYNYTTVIIVKL